MGRTIMQAFRARVAKALAPVRSDAMYRALDAARIVATAHALQQRIAERFPDAGLARVAGELCAAGRGDDGPARSLCAGPAGASGSATGLLIVAHHRRHPGMAITVSSLPGELQRPGCLRAGAGVGHQRCGLHGHRHRVPGDHRGPAPAASGTRAPCTSCAAWPTSWTCISSPRIPTSSCDARARNRLLRRNGALTPSQLNRYLDYCSELLSVISKVAALYAQQLNDPVVLAAVNEVEALTTGLSSKIWQKLVILGPGPRPAAPATNRQRLSWVGALRRTASSPAAAAPPHDALGAHGASPDTARGHRPAPPPR